MSLLAGFAVFFAEIGMAIYNRVHAHQFGIYGAERVGKTTLARQLQTRGEVAYIKKRTDGIQAPTRKMIKIDGDVRTIKSSDVGGQAIYWKQWEQDMRYSGSKDAGTAALAIIAGLLGGPNIGQDAPTGATNIKSYQGIFSYF